ncbi:MAG: 50S ribosomal protein L31e [Candidatus Pacearchaeota archaeon]
MAKEKKTEPRIVLEREYTIPLRREWLKVPEYKRANKAVKALKQFLVRHMKIYDRDLRKIKIDEFLNNEIRFRGIRKPPAKIRVRAKKFDNDIVKVELINLPTHIKFKKLREEKTNKKDKKEEPKVEKTEKSAEEERENKKETEKKEEKEEESREKNLKLTKEQNEIPKHISKDKKVMIRRKAMSR